LSFILICAVLLLIIFLPGGVSGFELGDECLEGSDGFLHLQGAGGGGEGGATGGDGGVRVVDGLGLADFVVGGLGGAFGRGENLFIQLFSGAQTGVFYLDIDLGFEAGEAYHAAGEVGNLDGFAHVEHEDFAAVAHGAGLQHEAAGLRDGHEEADDIRVGDGDGAAFLNLLAEAGDDGAVRPQHVAEAGGDVAGVRGIRGIGGELGVQALHVHLCRALGGAHHVGGVHGFVGRNHHEFLHAAFAGDFGHVDGALHVGDDGFAGVLFHERHVLIGRSVEDDGRAVRGDDAVAALAVAHIGHDGDDGHLRVFFLNLQADEVHGGLCAIQQDETGRGELAALAHDFAADAAGSAGDHDDAVADLGGDAVGFDDDFGALEQVLNLDGGDVKGGAGGHLVYIGDDIELHAGIGAPVGDAVAFALQGSIGDEDNGIGHVGSDVFPEGIHIVVAVDAELADGELGGIGIRVDDGGGEVGAAVGFLNIGGEGGGFLYMAVDEDFLGVLEVRVPLGEGKEAVVGADHGDAQADDEGAGDEEVADGEEQRTGGGLGCHELAGDADGYGDEAECADDAGQAAQAGVADDDFVEAEDEEDDGAVQRGGEPRGDESAGLSLRFLQGAGDKHGEQTGGGGAEQVQPQHDAAVQVVETLHAGAEPTGELEGLLLH